LANQKVDVGPARTVPRRKRVFRHVVIP
jgi:hypothetical protein